ELARRLHRVNFGAFVAAAYSGFVVWHGGLSGSIPLKIAGQDEILRQVYPSLSVPLSETIFSFNNFVILTLITLSFPLVTLWMKNSGKEIVFEAPEEKAENSKKKNLF